MARQDLINRAQMRCESQPPQPQTFAAGVDFIERNAQADNWFLQILFTTRATLKPQATLAPPSGWTQGCPLLRIASQHTVAHESDGARRDLLFDLQLDPAQQNPLHDEKIEADLRAHMARLMRECEAPSEQFERMGLQAQMHER